MALGLASSLATAADPVCQIELGSAVRAAPIQLTATGDDLHVKLVADPDLTLVAVSVVHDKTASVITTPAPVDSDGLVSVTVPNALLDADTRDIRYHLSVTDLNGATLMTPLPFALLLSCPGNNDAYEIIPGLSPGGLLVTRALADALASLPQCDVYNQVLTLANSADPELCTAATTLLHQLDLIDLGPNHPGAACRYEWQTVVPMGQGAWVQTQATALAQTAYLTLGQLGGLDSGAAACFGIQGTSLANEHTDWLFSFPGMAPGTAAGSAARGTTRVEQSVLCLEGGALCASDCAGTVHVSLDYAGCVLAQALSCDLASQASSLARHDWGLWVNDNAIHLGAPLAASAVAEPGGAPTSAAAGDVRHRGPIDSLTPTHVRLKGEAELSYEASSPAVGGTTFVFAETNTTFTLTLAASQATCTESTTVTTIVTTPTLPKSRYSGGLKMKRWWPDGDPNTWFTSGWPGPPPPLICDGIDFP